MADDSKPMLGRVAERFAKRTTHSQRRESQRLKAVTTREQRRRERQQVARDLASRHPDYTTESADG